jgi:integrase
MSGHIRRRGERSWELKYDADRDPATGKRRVRYVSFRGTKRAAEIELATLIAKNASGQSVDPSAETVRTFGERWLRDWAAINVGPKSLERFEELFRLYVVPHLGSTRIQKLRPVHLAETYAALLRAGGQEGRPLSARSVGHTHRLLHRMLGHAAEWGVTLQNVASIAKPPRVEETEIEILREGEAQSLVEKLRGRSVYIVALLGLATGMRRGEMLAVCWQDIDLAAGKLRVERSLEQTRKGGVRFKVPKTKKSRRTITLPLYLITALREHRKAQQERWLALGLGKVRDDALVLATWDGQPRTPGGLSKDWSGTMSELGLSITLHSLRHTHASQLIAAGMDVITISRRLGHASAAITLAVYGHLFSVAGDGQAAQIMQAAFSRPTVK